MRVAVSMETEGRELASSGCSGADCASAKGFAGLDDLLDRRFFLSILPQLAGQYPAVGEARLRRSVLLIPPQTCEK